MLFMTKLTHCTEADLSSLLDEMIAECEMAYSAGEADGLDFNDAIANIWTLLDEYEDRGLALPFPVPAYLLPGA
jgi:hypothetical protein